MAKCPVLGAKGQWRTMPSGDAPAELWRGGESGRREVGRSGCGQCLWPETSDRTEGRKWASGTCWLGRCPALFSTLSEQLMSGRRAWWPLAGMVGMFSAEKDVSQQPDGAALPSLGDGQIQISLWAAVEGPASAQPLLHVWLPQKLRTCVLASDLARGLSFGGSFKRNLNQGFPGGSDGEESACNAGDLGLILG